MLMGFEAGTEYRSPKKRMLFLKRKGITKRDPLREAQITCRESTPLCQVKEEGKHKKASIERNRNLCSND